MKKIKSRLIEKDEFERIIKRLSYEIIEKYDDLSTAALVGIRTRGEFLAKRIHQSIKNKT